MSSCSSLYRQIQAGTLDPSTLTAQQIADSWHCMSELDRSALAAMVAGGASAVAPGVSSPNLTADGNYEVTWPGGNGQVSGQGTFGGGTLSLEFSLDDGTTWTLLKKVETATDPDPTLTENGSFVFWSAPTSAPGYRLRLTLAGATTPNINVYI